MWPNPSLFPQIAKFWNLIMYAITTPLAVFLQFWEQPAVEAAENADSKSITIIRSEAVPMHERDLGGAFDRANLVKDRRCVGYGCIRPLGFDRCRPQEIRIFDWHQTRRIADVRYHFALAALIQVKLDL